MTETASRGKIIAPGTIRFERELPGDINTAWAFLTESGKRALWLAGGEMEPRVGGKVELRFRHNDLSPVTMPLPDRFSSYAAGSSLKGVVTAWDPPRLLGFTWNEDREEPSEVIFELEEKGATTRLTLTHRRLGDEVQELANVGAGWHTHLGILIERMAGRTPEPFFTRFEEVEAEYAQALLADKSVRKAD